MLLLLCSYGNFSLDQMYYILWIIDIVDNKASNLFNFHKPISNLLAKNIQFLINRSQQLKLETGQDHRVFEYGSLQTETSYLITLTHKFEIIPCLLLKQNYTDSTVENYDLKTVRKSMINNLFSNLLNQ